MQQVYNINGTMTPVTPETKALVETAEGIVQLAEAHTVDVVAALSISTGPALTAQHAEDPTRHLANVLAAIATLTRQAVEDTHTTTDHILGMVAQVIKETDDRHTDH